MEIRKAVLPVAGLGTRFLPATKAQPKEMLPIVDKPLVQYAVEEVESSGIPIAVFVTGRGKDPSRTILTFPSNSSTCWRAAVRKKCLSKSARSQNWFR